MNEARQRVYDRLALSNERWQRRQMSRMLATAVAFLSVCWFVMGVRAQTCDLTLDKSPEVKGLRLGMSEKEAAAVIRNPFVPDMMEPKYLNAISLGKEKLSGFNGVDILRVKAFDGRLSHIEINYDVEWQDGREFIDNFAPKLGLPLKGWQMDIMGKSGTLECTGFTIKLDAFYKGRLVLMDTDVPKRIAELKRQYEDDKKKAIKP